MTMRHMEHKVYQFTKDQHWRAGVSDQFEISDGKLITAAQLSLSPLPKTSSLDNSPALSVDPCADVFWARNDFQLVRSLPSGPIELGNLDVESGQWRPQELVMGYQQIWLLISSDRTRLMRYVSRNLQRLSPPKLQAEVIAICTDGDDGVWAIYQGDSGTELAHIGPAGKVVKVIELAVTIIDAKLAITRQLDQLIILDRNPQLAPCDTELAWRIWQVEICTGQGSAIFELPKQNHSCYRNVPDYQAQQITIDTKNRVSLCGPVYQEGSVVDWPVWTLSTDGEVQAQSSNVFSSRWLPIVALTSSEDRYVSGAYGVAKLCRMETAQRPQPDRIPTYITPTLISPEHAQRGWMRADIDIEMEAGVAVEISVASSRDQSLIEEADALFSNTELPTRYRLHQIQKLLPWQDQFTKLYQAAHTPKGASLRFPLQEIEATHIWLQIRLHPVPGFNAPVLNTMRILYPNVSYIRYLPSVYQKDSVASQFLRRLLTLFEGTLGDLDAVLAAMPYNIDPLTAPAHWLPFLLSWLGLPPVGELDADKQRQFVLLAPLLLRYRGTLEALRYFLQFLVGERFTISDSGIRPAPWMLCPATPDYTPRLGSDTLLLSQKQPAFRAGRSILGEQVLGFQGVDAMDLFTRRRAVVVIRIAEIHARKANTQALVERYIPYLIPAHCRYRLHLVSQTQLPQQHVFDQELHVEKESLPQLSIDSIAGEFYLPTHEETQDDTHIGSTSYLDDMYL